MNNTSNDSVSLKKSFSFRLGTTSYIIPDDVLPNIVFLADKIDDVELVLFQSDEISNIPTHEQVKELRNIADDKGLSYTVHLPLDTWTGSTDEAIRRSSVEKIKRVMDRMAPVAPVAPFAYICHLHGEKRGKKPVNDPAAWTAQHVKSLTEILSIAEPRDICIETLDYPFSMVENIVWDLNLSICLDIGHLIIGGYDVEDHLDKYLARARVLHLHGVNQGKDHTDISHVDPALLNELMERINKDSEPERVCTLEIFSQKHFERSLKVLRPYANPA
ncbi:MAG: sugar phosphate isomerase/epimerase [Desulfatibacillum sp.]|nr:sugar phosphate isomerase/epimerase [Desulfatibacillum sp.]